MCVRRIIPAVFNDHCEQSLKWGKLPFFIIWQNERQTEGGEREREVERE